MTVSLRSKGVVTSDGVRLHVVHAGRQGHPVLFLHGFPEFWLAWSEQLYDLGQDHRAAAMDLRGYHRSDRPRSPRDYRMQVLVADVRTVLAQLAGDQPATLVGHDWGGIIAWEFARIYPELLHQLVIINAPHPAIFARELAHNRAQRRASRYVLLFRRRFLAEWVLRAGNYAWLRRSVFGGAASPEAFPAGKRAAYLEAWRRRGALTGGLNYYRAPGWAAMVAAHQRERIQVPTLVLWGERDRYLLPGNLDGLQECVPQLRLVRFPTATHWLVHEQPAQVNAELRRGMQV
jgi:epoxide hydrolase 4